MSDRIVTAQELWKLRQDYRKLRHSCGYTGANKYRFDPSCIKCVARDNLRDVEEDYRKASEYASSNPDIRHYTKAPTLDDYDRFIK